MTSELRVDKIHNEGGDNDSGIDLSTNDQIVLKTANTTRLTMNSTGQTTIVGEGGSTTTNLQQGLAKAWVNLNGTGTAAVRDSFNNASITDNGTGDYSTTVTNAFGSVNYVCVATAGQNSGDQAAASNNEAGTNRTTTVIKTQVQRSTSDSALDVSVCEMTKMGDLA